MKTGPRSVSTLEHIKANLKAMPNGCHEWQGSCNNKGYGTTGHGGKKVLVHRYLYAEECEPLAPEDKVLHSCDNPPCCNLDHLSKGTQGKNLQDAYDRDRRVAANKTPGPIKQKILSLFGTGTYHAIAARCEVSRMTVVRTYEEAGLTSSRKGV